MIGFIKGLFNSQPKSVEPEVQSKVAAPSQKPSVYFLNADDALTLGDVNYMRTSKSVKKTFPKMYDGKDKTVEPIVQTDSFGKAIATETPVSESTPAPSAETEGLSERRRSDANLDMFRNMARNLKKS